MRRACVFCNGPFKDSTRLRDLLGRCDLVVAADGGERHIATLGMKPDVVIGDMDSCPSGWGEDDAGVERICMPAGKNQSDAELAVETAFCRRCEQVFLVAAVGGRLDHTLGNVALAARFPFRVAILDGDVMLLAADPSRKCVLRGPVGSCVSLVQFGTGEARLWATGLKYPLWDEGLKFPTHGISNELVEKEARLFVSQGLVLVCMEGGEICPMS